MRMTPLCADGLNGVENQVEKGLAQELFVGLDDERLPRELQAGFSFRRCRKFKGVSHFADDGAQDWWRRGGLRAGGSS